MAARTRLMTVGDRAFIDAAARVWNELPLTVINGRDRLASLGHPSKFQRFSHLGFVTAATSLNGGQPNFA